MNEKTIEPGLLVGEVIAKYRRAKGISQRELEYQLSQQGVQARQATISQWENNEAVPDTDKILPLSRILDVAAQELQSARMESLKTIGRHSKELVLNIEQQAQRVRIQEILELTDDEARLLQLWRAADYRAVINYALQKAGLK